MPVGLSEPIWNSVVHSFGDGDVAFGYVDVVGGGEPPGLELIYGRPSCEFANRWDLIDPDTLQWATAATLIYHPWNGEVLLDTTGSSGGHIAGVLLNSAGKFLPNGFTPIAEGPYNFAGVDEVFLFADAIEPGQYSIGEILRPNLSSAEFAATFTNAQFIGRAGFNGGSFDFVVNGLPMSLQYVPEPGPSVMLLGIVCCFCFRRSQSRFNQINLDHF